MEWRQISTIWILTERLEGGQNELEAEIARREPVEQEAERQNVALGFDNSLLRFDELILAHVQLLDDFVADRIVRSFHRISPSFCHSFIRRPRRFDQVVVVVSSAGVIRPFQSARHSEAEMFFVNFHQVRLSFARRAISEIVARRGETRMREDRGQLV